MRRDFRITFAKETALRFCGEEWKSVVIDDRVVGFMVVAKCVQLA